jgi:hypothetical protein
MVRGIIPLTIPMGGLMIRLAANKLNGLGDGGPIHPARGPSVGRYGCNVAGQGPGLLNPFCGPWDGLVTAPTMGMYPTDSAIPIGRHCQNRGPNRCRGRGFVGVFDMAMQPSSSALAPELSHLRGVPAPS